MVRCFASIPVVVLVLSTPPATAAPAGWANWRGPLGTGVAPAADPPLAWSETENVRFKVPIPGRGNGSPVVWEDRIFVLTSVPAGGPDARLREAAGSAPRRGARPTLQRFVVMALSRRDGSLLWERTAVESTPSEGHHPDGSWASASAVTDGERLIAHFGSRGTFAYSLDGELLWQVDLGEMTKRLGFGEGSSPALHDGRVIVNWDHEGDSFLVALDARKGKELWRVARPSEGSSWSTPLVVERDGGAQVVVAATGKSRGYDFETGRELWRVSGMTGNVIPTPVERDGVVYLASGFRGHALQAVDLDKAAGDARASGGLLWSHDRGTPYVPSLLLYDDQLYFFKVFGNILTSLDARTGRVLIDEVRVPSLHNIYASPVGAAGRIYLFDRDGHAVVLRHGTALEVLAENELAEGGEATPALVDGEIFLRTRGHLYALAAEPAPAAGDAP